MLLIFRWWYFLGLGGAILMGVGTVQTRLSARCGSTPIDVSLESLQRGEVPAQPHTRLDAHTALFDHAVEWGTRDRTDWYCYPVVASDHPYLEAWRRLMSRYRTIGDIPPAEHPSLGDLHVVVQVHPGNGATVPDEWRQVNSLEGILFGFHELNGDEQQVMREIAGSQDPARLFLLEAGRRPWPMWFGIVCGTGGVMMLLQAIRLFRRPRPAA